MNIDNARALKASLLTTTMKSLNAPTALRALGIRAQAAGAAKEPIRTVAIGISRSGKQHTLAIRVQHRGMMNHPVIQDMRKKAKGEVDVRYVGRLIKLETPATLQKRRRPLVIGCSIGHFAITAGTLGCFVTDRKTKAALILSNNHVLANENNAKKGDAIIQPGDFDGGKRPKDVVAKLRNFVALKPAATNMVDCAVAAPSKRSLSTRINSARSGRSPDLARRSSTKAQSSARSAERPAKRPAASRHSNSTMSWSATTSAISGSTIRLKSKERAPDPSATAATAARRLWTPIAWLSRCCSPAAIQAAATGWD